MANILIVAVIAVLVIYGIMSYRKKLTSGCCGAGGDSVKKVRVTDRNPSHYPYMVTLSIDGMICGNCAARVENALNAMDGVWARVDLEKKTALVRMKAPIEERTLRQTVNETGYTVMKVM